MRRAAQKTATREALLAAARRCFAGGSYRGTSIGAIAREAGVATGTVYVHFNGKEALLDALLEEFNAGLVARLAPLWREGLGDPEALVRATAEVCLDYWGERRGLLEAFVRRAADAGDLGALRDGISPPLAELVGGALTEVAQFIGAPPAQLELATQGLLGLWTRVGLQALFNPAVTREAAVETLTRMSLGAVRALLPGSP